MLKGKTVIELTDVHTGQTEVYEDTNMVTEALMDIFNTVSSSKISLDDILEFNYEVSIGDEKLSLAEFNDLVKCRIR